MTDEQAIMQEIDDQETNDAYRQYGDDIISGQRLA